MSRAPVRSARSKFAADKSDRSILILTRIAHERSHLERLLPLS